MFACAADRAGDRRAAGAVCLCCVGQRCVCACACDLIRIEVSRAEPSRVAHLNAGASANSNSNEPPPNLACNPIRIGSKSAPDLRAEVAKQCNKIATCARRVALGARFARVRRSQRAVEWVRAKVSKLCFDSFSQSFRRSWSNSKVDPLSGRLFPIASRKSR